MQFCPKIDILVSFDQNREFSTILTIIEIFFTKIDILDCHQNLEFSTILVFFDKFYQIWDLSTICYNRYFRKFWPKSRFLDTFFFFTKIYIFANFDPSRHFSEILTNRRFGEKFLPKSILPKILTKIEIFWKCWPRSRFSNNFDQNRDFRKLWPKSRFS